MQNRWLILVVLVFARTVMAFQFHSIASLSTLMLQNLTLDFTQLGALVGFYMLPGVFLAFPGGVLGNRFGDKRIVLAALMFMAIGGFLTGASDSFNFIAIGRLMSGAGGVLLNVLLTKMVIDWFADGEIVTAMGILISSWPLGISLALVLLGPIGEVFSWQFAVHLTGLLCLVAWVLTAVIYQAPDSLEKKPGLSSSKNKLSGSELGLITLAGMVWTFYNVGFIVLMSFGPEFLASSGYEMANSLVSAVTWVLILSVSIGGYLAQKMGKPDWIMTVCFIGVGVGIFLVPNLENALLLFIATGLLFGPPGGLIMALPSEVLNPENRAPGMGIFMTVYYVGMAGLPVLAGLTRDLTDIASVPIYFGSILLFVTVICLGVFRFFQARLRAIAQ